MKKLLAIAAIFLGAVTANASGTIDIKGSPYKLDTLYHATVGPGTTQTHLQLKGNYLLQVYYLTIDISNPRVSLRTVCATNKVAGTQRTSAMAKANSDENTHYFCGTNGDFYWTSGTATNGSSKIGTPTTSTIVNGEIYKSSTANYQFVVDTEGRPTITRLNYYTGTATLGDKVTLFKGVNVDSPNNGLTIYTPRYFGSANQTDYAGTCQQVTARLVEGQFLAGGKYKLEITSEPNTTGDTPVPDNGFVIHARGNSKTGCNTGATDFVAALRPGDVVEFDNIILTADGNPITPLNVVSGNPRNVGQGQTLDSEWERGDASAQHPRTCIGYSQDGNTVIMMVIDGRTSNSAGVTTSMLADVMRYAGAYEAVNLDGGGSSTLYVEALGVRNNTSDGSERAVGNAIFAVLNAPTDNQVATIRFRDWAKTLPCLGIYTPVVYGYNQYGQLIDTDFKDFILSAPDGLASVSADGHSISLPATEGPFALKATFGNSEAILPVNVIDAGDFSCPRTYAYVDATKSWEIPLECTLNGETMPIASNALTWTSTDPEIASVTPEGFVTALGMGTTQLYGVRGDKRIQFNVTVEIPTTSTRPCRYEAGATGSSSAINDFVFQEVGDGYVFDGTYKGRGAYMKVEPYAYFTYANPAGFRMRFNPAETPIKNIVFKISHNLNKSRTYETVTFTDFTPNVENTIYLPFDSLYNTNDFRLFPIGLHAVTFNLNGTVGAPCHIEVPALEAVYTPEQMVGGKAEIESDQTQPAISDGQPRYYDLMGRPLQQPAAPGFYLDAQTKSKHLLK